MKKMLKLITITLVHYKSDDYYFMFLFLCYFELEEKYSNVSYFFYNNMILLDSPILTTDNIIASTTNETHRL